MGSDIDILITEMTVQNERIAELEYTLEQLKSQLLDTYAEDSVIITIINNSLKK
jgi:predicted nucleotidyltransferase